MRFPSRSRSGGASGFGGAVLSLCSGQRSGLTPGRHRARRRCTVALRHGERRGLARTKRLRGFGYGGRRWLSGRRFEPRSRHRRAGQGAGIGCHAIMVHPDLDGLLLARRRAAGSVLAFRSERERSKPGACVAGRSAADFSGIGQPKESATRDRVNPQEPKNSDSVQLFSRPRSIPSHCSRWAPQAARAQRAARAWWGRLGARGQRGKAPERRQARFPQLRRRQCQGSCGRHAARKCAVGNVRDLADTILRRQRLHRVLACGGRSLVHSPYDVSQHSSSAQLRTAGDGRGGARRRAAVRAQGGRRRQAVTRQRSDVPARGGRGGRATQRLLEALVTSAPPRNREVEAAKARARAAQRFGGASAAPAAPARG